MFRIIIYLLDIYNSMFHTSGLKTSLIDSVYDRANFRTEFRFDADKIYLSNMRLLDVGVLSNDATNRPYNRLVGAYGIIKQITLTDGNEVLSSMQDFNRYSAFKSYVKKNDANNSVNSYLAKNNMGYIFEGTDFIDSATQSVNLQYLQDSAPITNSAATTAVGWLSLRDCIPFLNASPYVPTNVFKNLRLVVEYDTRDSSFALNSAAKYSTIEPLLVAEEMVNSSVAMQMMKDYNSLQWTDVETDRMYLPAVSDVTIDSLNTKQSQTFLIGGYNNKRVGRVVLCNVPTVEATYKGGDNYAAFSNMGSMSMIKQSVQVILNGSNVFPVPVDTANKRLAMLVDNYGDATQPLGYGALYDPSMSEIVSNNLEVLNTTDYMVFSLGGARVQDLQLEYNRLGQFVTGSANQQLERFNQPLVLQTFAEVQKTMTLGSKGNYVIGYA
jgi:hypothetical protein